MPHFMTMKQQIKRDVIAALNDNPVIEQEKLVAELSLKYGFTDKTIGKILKQMEILNYLEIDNNVIKRPDVKDVGGK